MAVKRINLALQGGGAHGAFTWGVLDRLLEEDDIEIAAISGTSAGALNGAALKAGLARGGPDAARENLAWLWAQVTSVNDMRLTHWMAQFWPGSDAMTGFMDTAFPFSFTDAAARMFSPYAYGPFYTNPLQRVVDQFDFANVCHETGPQLFVAATNVRSGKIRVFTGTEVTTEVILASACLPTLFQAVEITDPKTQETDAYWDGGYTGNPALFPLFDHDLPDDIVIVNINPMYRQEVPVSAQDIHDRINEISFNTSLLRELRAISFVKTLVREGRIEPGAMKNVLVHMIADDALMNGLSQSTKLMPTTAFVEQLRDSGRDTASAFLDQHKADLNHNSTVRLSEMFD